MNRNQMEHIADVEFTVVRMDSPYVPFRIESADVTGVGNFSNEDGEYQVREDLGLLETKHIELPKSVREMSFDLLATIKAQLWGHYYSFETDCGTEYDADFEFRNEAVSFAPIPDDSDTIQPLSTP